MIVADDLSSCSAQVANLTLAVGIGVSGEKVIGELRTLLLTAEDGHRRAVASWCSADQASGPSAAAGLLLSNGNLDALEQAGYQVPGRGVGQPPRLSVAYIADLDDRGVDQALDAARNDLNSVSASAEQSLIALSTGQIADILLSEAVAKRTWDFVMPISSQDRVAGARSESDLIATVARIVLIFSVADQSHYGSKVLGRPGSSGVPGTPVVRIGGAFLDGGRSDLVKALSGLMACRLLGLQFESPASSRPTEAFDDQRRTKLLGLIKPETLGRRLLGDTPFALSVDEGEVWHIELPAGIVAAELHRLPRRRWIAALQKLRDLFDFTKARRWAESVERSEASLLASLQDVIQEDARQLHHYERGPDRLLSWASVARDLLEAQPEIVQPANADINTAIQDLRVQIQRFPNTIAFWARVVLLGWIGAEGVRHLFRSLLGDAIGWAGFASTLIVAAILGLRRLESAHQVLQSTLRAAQAALTQRYEVQMSENLSRVLNRVRSRLMATLDMEVSKVRNQAQCSLKITGVLIGEFGTTTATCLVNVEWIVPPDSRQRLLESLSVPWSSLHRQAAADGLFVPNPADGGDCMRQTVADLVDFSRLYIESRLDNLGLQGLVDFRAQEDPGFEERIVRDLDRRATALTGRSPLRTSWHGPADVLTRFHEKIGALDPDAKEQPSASGMVACLKVGGNFTLLPGDSK